MLLFTFIIDDGDDQSFLESIYVKYYPILKYTAANICGMDMADDVVQAAFVKLIKYIEKLKSLDEKALITYLVYTVKSTAIDFQKKVSQQNKLKQKLIHQPSYYDSPDSISLGIEVEMESVLAQLSERDRDLLVYCYYLDLEEREIAKIMDIKPTSIRMAVSRARKRALKLLKKEGDKDDNK